MARRPRFSLPDMPQHIVQRGNNRNPCFFAAEDYRRYLDVLREAADRHQCRIHAYVLMTNHVHILVTPATGNAISQLMQSVGRRYVRYVNQSRGRSGTLWEGRYRGSLVDTDGYLLTCYRYIELNPVRAGLVQGPADYPWSSFHANALGRTDDLLTPHPAYLALGAEPSSRRQRYLALFDAPVEHALLEELRDAVRAGLVAGSEHFKDEVAARSRMRTRRGKAGRPRLLSRSVLAEMGP